MTDTSAACDVSTCLARLDAAVSGARLSAGAAENIRRWLTEPRYAAYAAQVCQHVAEEKWQTLDDVFWTIIPFGTGGRRGRMYPIGSNAINERTIGESAQGLATYVRQHREGSGPLSCAIAYDTRHRSTEFARLCGEIMVANGFQVYFLEPHRSTPELSFLVRYKRCCCGIMVTASHNPPSDNAVKAYWSTGGQLLPPHDKGVIDCVMHVEEIRRADFDQARADGRVVNCTEEVDAAFIDQVRRQAFPGPRDMKIIYSPLHGVGATCVCPALEADGFRDVELFGPHAQPDGDFPNVPDHVANPENRPVFDAIIQRARQVQADVILATDPDCDRLGCAAPLTLDRSGPWETFTGNQIAALLADYVLEQRRAAATLSPQHYLVTTLVTTAMVRRIGQSYGVRTFDNLHVGFKWIAGTIDQQGPELFVYGTEESHGYLVGQHVRDKDGAAASMLMAELAAAVKARGQSLHEKLAALYWQHGYHEERVLNIKMEGSQGMQRMRDLMQRLRQQPPRQLAEMPVTELRDYQAGTRTPAGGAPQPLDGPPGDMVVLDLATDGNYVAVRPSGTEPKVKLYMFAYVPAEQLADLDAARREVDQQLTAIERDLRALADSV